ncbi:MAG: sigma-70 family RNA polymerase sigma factor [Anaerolineae bacterium]|nr:sigma-70 family RNA polymerase sigma factor [Anaerolineae bacterium]
MSERTNEQWLAALGSPGADYDAALADLRAQLVKGLGYALSAPGNIRPEDLEDFAQDALLKILDGLHTFRGESKFMTWAQKIAVRVAFSELRRRRWRDTSLDAMTEGVGGGEFIPPELIDPDADSEQQAMQRLLLQRVRYVIDHELTDRQRRALVAAVLHGVPPDELARRMDTNRNAVYKLIHDARKRLKKQLLATGLSAQEVLAVFE